MKFFQRFMTMIFETADPHLEKITDPQIQNVARVAMPLTGMLTFVWLVSMPFTLAGQIVDAFVKIATSVN